MPPRQWVAFQRAPSFSFGIFTTEGEIKKAIEAIERIASGKG